MREPALAPETTAVQVTGVPSGTGEGIEVCKVTVIAAGRCDTATSGSRRRGRFRARSDFITFYR
jgi:hypothetical protein